MAASNQHENVLSLVVCMTDPTPWHSKEGARRNTLSAWLQVATKHSCKHVWFHWANAPPNPAMGSMRFCRALSSLPCSSARTCYLLGRSLAGIITDTLPIFLLKQMVVSKLSQCLSEINSWVSANWLKINPRKTEGLCWRAQYHLAQSSSGKISFDGHLFT